MKSSWCEKLKMKEADIMRIYERWWENAWGKSCTFLGEIFWQRIRWAKLPLSPEGPLWSYDFFVPPLRANGYAPTLGDGTANQLLALHLVPMQALNGTKCILHVWNVISGHTTQSFKWWLRRGGKRIGLCKWHVGAKSAVAAIAG